MGLNVQTLDFLKFVLVGFSITLIFDLFRAIRKFFKKAKGFIVLQDLIFAIIATTFTTLVILKLVKSEIRPYMFAAMCLGIMTYLYIVGDYIIRFFVEIFKLITKLINIFLIPFRKILSFFIKIFEIIYNFVKKCCKKFYYLIYRNRIHIFDYRNMIKNVKSKFSIKYKRGKYEKKE